MNFDERAATWDDDPAKIERAQRVAALLREHLPLTGSEKILDIGGGTGQLSFNLAGDVADVTISDASAGMIEVATRGIETLRLGDRYRAVQLDLTTDTPPAEDFDGAWSHLALHHVPDVDLLLGKVYALLRPGGWFAVVDLDHDAHGAFHQHLHSQQEKHEHGRGEHGDEFLVHDGFDREGFAERLRAAGFTRVDITDGGVVTREVEDQQADFPMFLAVAYRE
ncbi:methyltransferase type 11 [Enemella evansiae]|uniref:class I SAM-dependent methyltransferase n=1 Tax=Enemella evansiae TaxID=2016499 RepID=UPI000B963B6C|nr:class I SAM-dependent methyltransferase [Enemella evansiae]OYO11273.1 methyltransferase type 11 [Enemella evansiae]